MTASTAVPTRGRRHPMSVVTEARRLHAAGWNDVQIVNLLAREGVTVTKATVGRWVKPKREQTWRAECERFGAVRAAERGGKPLGRRDARPEYKLARMQALRELGVSFNSIAKVMGFDFGDELTEDQVRHALDLGRYPKRTSRSRS